MLSFLDLFASLNRPQDLADLYYLRELQEGPAND